MDPRLGSATHTALAAPLHPPLAPGAALVEADRCLGCGGLDAAAPCAAACPAEIDVPRFIDQIAAGDDVGAAQTIFAANLLGGTCARVCPVEVLCEGACVLHHEGRKPIAIGLLQRHATDVAFAKREGPVRPVAPRRSERVAIVGAGPAGLVCAGELAARGFTVTVHDEHTEVGGLARYAIAPYRIGSDPLDSERLQIEELGVAFRLGHPIDGEHLEEIGEADAIFLGIGMGADTAIHYPGDGLNGVWESLPFIEALKFGTPPNVGTHAVVIGGGNTAIDVAREAVRLGARTVTLVYRRTRAEMPAFEHEIAEAEDEGVRFAYLTDPVRILGEHHVEGVECLSMSLGEPDASGRRRPQPVTGSERTLIADSVIKAIGQQPHREAAAWFGGLAFDGSRLAIDPTTLQTSNPKVFAGGDVVGGTSVVQAVRDGKHAATAIEEWLCRS